MTQATPITKDGNIVDIKVETKTKGTFFIPVCDVRVNRERAENLQKANNIARASIFIKPTMSWLGFTYNDSMKQIPKLNTQI